MFNKSIKRKVTYSILSIPFIMLVLALFNNVILFSKQIESEALHSIEERRLSVLKELELSSENYYSRSYSISRDVGLIVPLYYNIVYQAHTKLEEFKEKYGYENIAIINENREIIVTSEKDNISDHSSKYTNIDNVFNQKNVLRCIDNNILLTSIIRIEYKKLYLGHIVATKRLDISKFLNKLFILKNHDKVETNTRTSFKNFPISDISKKLHNRKVLRYQRSFFGMEYLYDYKKSPVARIVFYKDFTDRFLARDNQTIWIIVISLIIIASITLIGFALTKNISSPIIKLTDISKEITRGNYSVIKSKSIKSSDEIGLLFDNFKLMIDKLLKIQNELRIEKNNAEEATKAKSRFLANMSHEIRTPMNGIIGLVDILIENSDDKKQLDYLGIIKTSSDTLLSIINDILDFSKIEANKIILENMPFDIYSLAESTVKSFSAEANKKELDLILDIESDVPQIVTGDSLRLRQILYNILGNAVKFTLQGHIYINIKKRYVRDGVVHLNFFIEDTGIGIKQERIKTIFNSFQQEDSTTTRRFGGTGLGTTISKKLVELMGGNIYAISPNPKISEGSHPGTVFGFDLPFNYDEKKQLSLSDVAFDKIKALIIDKNPISNMTLNKVLAGHTGKIVNAVSGESALKLIRLAHQQDNPYSLLLIDYQTLNSSSIDNFFEELKQVNSEYRPHVIILTQVETDADAHKNSYNISEFLIKPVTKYKLLNAIRVAISKSKFSNKKRIKEVKEQIDKEKINILLAEDNAINQKVAVRLFENLGYSIDIADDGAKSLDMIKHKRYDLIFMDIMMPNMDGVEASMRIKKMGIKTPVIAMTANAMKGDRENFIEQGMDDYISKPVKKDSLKRVIHKWIR